jgi:fumarylpyruvate hydrolase
MKTVIPPFAPATVPVQGSSEVFPVRRIFCVGRNYAAHAREMGADPSREPPFFFSKPADAVIAGPEVPYPSATADLHHEVELVVALAKGGAEIDPASALELVWGYGVGVDLTRRDLQDVAKKNGRPWDMAKGFDCSAPISPLVPATVCGHPAKGAVTLAVNGQQKQAGDLADMIWPVPDVLAHLSRLVRLAPGDLIFTGTPEGVGRIVRGDLIQASVAGVALLQFRMV